MKYIFKNMIGFIKLDKMICFLSVVSIVVSAFVINFSYGVYQNYNIVLGDAVMGEDELSMFFRNTPEDYVTKDMLDTCIQELIDNSSNMNNHVHMCRAGGMIDGMYYQFNFSMDEDSIEVADVLAENLYRNELITEGSYWSSINEKEGTLVALCYDCRADDMFIEFAKSLIQEDGTLLVGGKNYTIIGYQYWTENGTPLIPYSTIDSNTQIEDFLIMFDEKISRPTYTWIVEMFERVMGDKVDFWEVPGIDKDSYYTYRTIIIVVMLLTVVSAINYTILYLYIMVKRKKQTKVFRICGMPLWKINFINIGECLLISTPLYAVTTIVYDRLILPHMDAYFPYMKNSYSLGIYLLIFGIYFLTSVIVCSIMIIRKNQSVMGDYC